MSAKVDLYNNAYGHYSEEAYREIRIETYGYDLGQTSWVSTEESEEIPRTLGLMSSSYVLEVGCGSGRYALQVAETLGCRVLGVDANQSGIHTANELARAKSLSDRVRFEHGDASEKLPFGDGTFDAAFANDVLCHVPGRTEVLGELFRVIRAGGKFLFSDALVIGGMISHQEIANRSSIGQYIFSPPGENERLLRQQGFRVLSVTDTSKNAAAIAKRWHDARQNKREALSTIEGKENFEGLQQFLATVHTVSGEGRLRRYLYLAERPGESAMSSS